MSIRSVHLKSGASAKKSRTAKKPLGASKKTAVRSEPLTSEGPSIAVTLFGKLKETDPMYTANAIDALFEKQQNAIDTHENKKKLALETIKTIATLGQNSSLRETIAVVKGIGEMLQSLYEAMNKEESTETS